MRSVREALGVKQGQAELETSCADGGAFAPAESDEAPSPSASSSPVSSGESERPFTANGIRVLVVDDEPDGRELVAYILEMRGMSVRGVSSVAEAMVAIAAFAPQVIVSDIGMPYEDGYSLIRSVRSLPSDANKVPAIALTAFARVDDKARALSAGFDHYIAKPVDPQTLVAAVVSLAASDRPGA